MTEAPKIEFPCDDYPIKVMGRASAGFRARVDEVFARHFGAFAFEKVTERASSHANFTAITYVMRVSDARQLEVLHTDLKECEDVVMVL
ncbi:MAG: DUF493 domain-containing protein [Steroidobacteraceae bacterium]